MSGRHINLLLGKVFSAFGRKPLYNPANPSRSKIPAPWDANTNTINSNMKPRFPYLNGSSQANKKQPYLEEFANTNGRNKKKI